MAIYHLSAKVIGRGDGRSAVACAAYRSGQALTDDRLGERFSFRDSGRVEHTEIVAPAGAPTWALDRSQLWNAVEAGERRKDAQLAREFEVALPNELSPRQQQELLSGWVQRELVAHGLVADIAIHRDRPQPGKPANDHAHVMTTMRAIAGDGFGPKLRELNDRAQLGHWRASWADACNAALERAGHEARIDHRSHADRGLDALPTVKEGPAPRAIEARGQPSILGSLNRWIRGENLRRAKEAARRLLHRRPWPAKAGQEAPEAAPGADRRAAAPSGLGDALAPPSGREKPSQGPAPAMSPATLAALRNRRGPSR